MKGSSYLCADKADVSQGPKTAWGFLVARPNGLVINERFASCSFVVVKSDRDKAKCVWGQPDCELVLCFVQCREHEVG